MAYRSRERVARVLAHGEADRVPFDAIGFPAGRALERPELAHLGEDERDYLTRGEFRYLTFRLEPDRDAFAPYVPDLPDGAEMSPWGVGRVRAKSVEGYEAGAKVFYPLAQVETVSELEAFPFPNMTAPECWDHLAAEAGAAQADGFTVIGQMSQTILETAYEMRGMPRLFTDFYVRPDYVRTLFEAICERRCFQARRFAEAGVDVLRIGDDIATQVGLLVGPPMYREWIKPYHARTVAAAREVKPDIQVLYHSDGALTPLLEDLIDAGVTAINPVQPEAIPPADVKQTHGDRLTLWGCTATQSTYTHGGRDDVRRDLESLMRHVAPDGGLVLQFYNMLVTPRVLDNLTAFADALFDVAQY